jgi:hypothetical protein
VVDYGERRTSGAALNVRGAFSDIALNPTNNYPAFVFNETTSTAGVNTLKYQYWDGTDYRIETINGGLTNTFVRLVFLSDGRPLVFWGNGVSALYMAARSTASVSAQGVWTVTLLDSASTAIRAIEASVSPDNQVMVAYATNTGGALRAYLCASNCHASANYINMTGNIDATIGTNTNQLGVGFCKNGTDYYPSILYSDTANAVLTMCRNSFASCSTATNWLAAPITLTGSGANLVASQMYIDSSTDNATAYMVVKHANGLRPYTFANCATNAAVTAADPAANHVVNTASVGNAYFNLAFDGTRFHIIANDGTTIIRYFNQPLASFGNATWTASAAPYVETTGAAGIAAAGNTRGGMVVDTVGDQILATYGRTAAVVPVHTYGNVVLAYNDCPAGLGAPACGASTLNSPADSNAMMWANAPLDVTGQVGRNTLQVPSTAAAVTSEGRPAGVYVDYSVGISAEPATGALLKYAYREGSTASSRYIKSIIPTTTAPASPSLAFDHNDKPWVSWYEYNSTAPISFRYHLATNSRTDGQGQWIVYNYPVPSATAAATTLPVHNSTKLVMYKSGGVSKPVMVILRNLATGRTVQAALFDPATGAWQNQQTIISLAGTTTPGGGWLAADADADGNIFVAVHDLGTGAGATCSPTTARCVRATYSTDGGVTWATAAQVFSGFAEGLDVKLNPTNNRPVISFYNRASNTVRVRECTTALASCLLGGSWADVGFPDLAAGVSTLVDNGATANIGLINTALNFSNTGDLGIAWSRGSGTIVNANLMYSYVNAGSFTLPTALMTNANGNEASPVAANAGNFALSWNAASARSSVSGSLHTFFYGPGNFLYAASCGN